MHRLTRSVAVVAVLLGISPIAAADQWECGEDGQSRCYVTDVRFVPEAVPYVRAGVSHPDSQSQCEHVRFVLDSGVTSEEALRGVEAVLLTALTTGLPIRFWRLTAHGNDRDCWASTNIVSKQGH